MNTFRTEEEQLDAIKRWWRENGISTAVGVVLALGAVFGWRGWQDHQQNRAAEASAVFQQLLEADAAYQRDGTRKLAAIELADTLRDDFAGHSYAHFASLMKAKYAAQDGNFAEAQTLLQNVLDDAPNQAVAQQVKVRLAQLSVAQQQYDQALTHLQGLEEGGYAPQAAEIRGDIKLAQGDSAGALEAYTEARRLSAESEIPTDNPVLEMKINDLRTQRSGSPDADQQGA